METKTKMKTSERYMNALNEMMQSGVFRIAKIPRNHKIANTFSKVVKLQNLVEPTKERGVFKWVGGDVSIELAQEVRQGVNQYINGQRAKREKNGNINGRRSRLSDLSPENASKPEQLDIFPKVSTATKTIGEISEAVSEEAMKLVKAVRRPFHPEEAVKNFTNDELIAELKRRGFTGNLTRNVEL